jgi:hypothetical protein
MTWDLESLDEAIAAKQAEAGPPEAWDMETLDAAIAQKEEEKGPISSYIDKLKELPGRVAELPGQIAEGALAGQTAGFAERAKGLTGPGAEEFQRETEELALQRKVKKFEAIGTGAELVSILTGPGSHVIGEVSREMGLPPGVAMALEVGAAIPEGIMGGRIIGKLASKIGQKVGREVTEEAVQQLVKGAAKPPTKIPISPDVPKKGLAQQPAGAARISVKNGKLMRIKAGGGESGTDLLNKYFDEHPDVDKITSYSLEGNPKTGKLVIAEAEGASASKAMRDFTNRKIKEGRAAITPEGKVEFYPAKKPVTVSKMAKDDPTKALEDMGAQLPPGYKQTPIEGGGLPAPADVGTHVGGVVKGQPKIAVTTLPDDAVEAFDALNRIRSRDAAKFSGGPVPKAKAIENANKLGLTDAEVRSWTSETGAFSHSGQATATKGLIVQRVRDVQTLIADGSLAEAQAMAHHVDEMILRFQGRISMVGRILNEHGMIKEAGIFDDYSKILKDLDGFSTQGSKAEADIAAKLKEWAKGAADMNKPGVLENINSIRINNVLLRVGTHVRNIVGNTLPIAARQLEHPVAVAIDAAVNRLSRGRLGGVLKGVLPKRPAPALPGGTQRSIFFAEQSAQSLRRAGREGVGAMRQAFRTGHSSGAFGSGEKLAGEFTRARAIFGEHPQFGIFSRVGGKRLSSTPIGRKVNSWLTRFARGPFRGFHQISGKALLGGDEFYKGFHFTTEASKAAKARLIRQGMGHRKDLHKQLVDKYIRATKEWVETGKKPSEKWLVDDIEGFRGVAETLTYTQPLGEVGKAALAFRRAGFSAGRLGKFRVGEYAVMFMKTNVNIVKWGYRHSPFGFIKFARGKGAEMTARNFAQELAQPVVGTMAMITTLPMVLRPMDGKSGITGSFPAPGQDPTGPMAVGYKNRAFRFQSGEGKNAKQIYITFDRLEPFGKQFGLFVDMAIITQDAIANPNANTRQLTDAFSTALTNAYLRESWVEQFSVLTDDFISMEGLIGRNLAAIVPGVFDEISLASEALRGRDISLKNPKTIADYFKVKFPYIRDDVADKRGDFDLKMIDERHALEAIFAPWKRSEVSAEERKNFEKMWETMLNNDETREIVFEILDGRRVLAKGNVDARINRALRRSKVGLRRAPSRARQSLRKEEDEEQQR